jgi:Domain of unknown function (DUF4349)
MRRTRTMWGLSLALLASGCGGAMNERPAMVPEPVAVAPPPAPAPPPGGRAKADRDSDGIPDSMDKCPEGGGGGDGCPTAASAIPSSATSAGGAKAAATDAPERDLQKLIYTAHLTMAVFQVEAALGKVEAIAREVGGYLSQREDREITIRVPRGRFDESIERVEATGDVLHRDIKAEDVTDEFFDLQTRLKNARVMRERLVVLLGKAAVKEAIDIEKELGRITEEIERMEGKLKLLGDKIAYSTITVSLQPVDSNPVTQAIALPFPWLQELGLAHLLSVK